MRTFDSDLVKAYCLRWKIVAIMARIDVKVRVVEAQLVEVQLVACRRGTTHGGQLRLFDMRDPALDAVEVTDHLQSGVTVSYRAVTASYRGVTVALL